MKKIITKGMLKEVCREDEYALVTNAGGLYPAADVLPLTKKRAYCRYLRTVVSDMDGTATTTENLCLHSLEYMLRKITERMDPATWEGLDKARDYPHVIGNSTTRHVEYLLERYRDAIREEAFASAFLEAVHWFERRGNDPARREEVRSNCTLIASPEVLRALQGHSQLPGAAALRALAMRCGLDTREKQVRAAVDIYYRRYHEILRAVDKESAIPESAMLRDMSRESLIEPMPGLAFFLLLIKGHLQAGEGVKLLPLLKKAYREKCGKEYAEEGQAAAARIASLCGRFRERPPQIALVTSSIPYEADIVMRRVFVKMRAELASWPLEKEKIRHFQNALRDHREFYDVIVTAGDSHEIRLKPHRDLYSIALNRLNLHRGDLDTVIGFEDSESGMLALRAAGVGCAVALPFHETSGHDLSAAAHIAEGGLPEVIMQRGFYLKGGP